MNISKFSTRLQELSEDYSSQRVMLDEYRAERKKILDEVDNLMNGVDCPSAVEEKLSEAATVINAVNIDGDINIIDSYDNDTNIDLRNVNQATINIDAGNIDASTGIEDDEIIKEDIFMDETESADDVSGVKAIGKKLNNILGRLNKSDDNKT